MIDDVISVYGVIKVKQSLYRPGHALGAPGGCSFQVFGLLAYEGDKVVIPAHWLPLFPGDVLDTHIY
jgi:hypothetical protein